MSRRTDRIYVSHAGVLPPSRALEDLALARPLDMAAFQQALPEAVAEVVHHQAEIGIDTVNDGELSKLGGFSGYIRDRMGGIAQHELTPGVAPRVSANVHDRLRFPGFYASGLGEFGGARRPPRPTATLASNDPFFAVEPLTYTGREAVEADIARLRAATEGLDVECFLAGIAPGTIEHWLRNDYYGSDEEFLFALADVLHEEFKAITDAGITVQIDDPDLPDGWQMFPDMSVADYRKYAELRVEAINHAIRGLPSELIRFHICWGSQHGPHQSDLPLREFVDIVLKVDAAVLSIEAANPVHEHEWTVWEDIEFPDGRALMPGVVGHATDLIEHPDLVAQRLVRYANILGRENVIAGTDCGIATRVGHAEICWAKLESLAKGAEIATQRLWG